MIIELQPIDTAPRDGTRVMVQRRRSPTAHVEFKPICIARWAHRRDGQGAGRWVLETSAGSYAQDPDIIGWAPLPEPVAES